MSFPPHLVPGFLQKYQQGQTPRPGRQSPQGVPVGDITWIQPPSKLGLPSPAAAPRAPLCPAMLLTPSQGAAIPLQPGNRSVAAVGCPQGTAPFPAGHAGEVAARWGVDPDPAPCTAPALWNSTGLVATAVSHYSVEGFSMGTVTKEHGMTATPTCPMGSAWSPHYMDQRDFHAPKPALKHMAPMCPWLCVHSKQKLSFY